jgi:hypothetical protein
MRECTIIKLNILSLLRKVISFAYFPLVVVSLLVSRPFGLVMDMPKCLVTCLDALWILHL